VGMTAIPFGAHQGQPSYGLAARSSKIVGRSRPFRRVRAQKQLPLPLTCPFRAQLDEEMEVDTIIANFTHRTSADPAKHITKL